MKKVRWIAPLLAALLFAPLAGAAERVVSVDGTAYTVEVVAAPGETSPEETALSYSVLHPDGFLESGLVPPTQDLGADLEPILALPPGGGGPFLVWTRNDGIHEQIAFSRYEGGAWGEIRLLTTGARDHVRPRAAVDGHGVGILLWSEPAEPMPVMFETFDPTTGNVLSAPRNLLQEMVRNSPPQWLSPGHAAQAVGGRPTSVAPTPQTEGGNDTPAIPPCNADNTTGCKKDSSTATVATLPGCSASAAAVARSGNLSLALLEGGVVVEYFRGGVPAGAPPDYVQLLLQSLLNQRCQL